MNERDSVIAHVRRKAATEHLDPDVAAAMIEALESGAASGYADAYRVAVFRPIPAVVYHTSPTSALEQIRATGLKAGKPSDGRWAAYHVDDQPAGVYVAAKPDLRGVWSESQQWLVWQVHTDGLAWERDTLNPGCWVICSDVPAEQVSLAHRLPELTP